MSVLPEIDHDKGEIIFTSSWFDTSVLSNSQKLNFILDSRGGVILSDDTRISLVGLSGAKVVHMYDGSNGGQIRHHFWERNIFFYPKHNVVCLDIRNSTSLEVKDCEK